jgi:hypothetical protein
VDYRADKRVFSVWLKNEMHDRLRALVARLRAEHGAKAVSAQGLIEEAINDLFKKYGEPPVE